VDFEQLRHEISSLDKLTRDAYVEEVLVVPMDAGAAMGWRRMADATNEGWVCAIRGDKTLAVDRPSALGHRNPIQAVVFPALHSQLVGWWLFHAWRSIDLLEASLDAVASGTTSVAAVTTRALIEEFGCLVSEVRLIKEAWEAAKLPNVELVRRAELLGRDLAPALVKMLFASRMSTKPAAAPDATNVLTYVSKLDKLSKTSKFSDWYNWLSDASHPAYGARLVYVTNPLRHASGSTVLRMHSRSPLRLVGPGGVETDFTYDIENKATEALKACGPLLVQHLYAALSLVDDFGLTTSAPALTERTYWRDFTPRPAVGECPCSCGSWKASLHKWGSKAPAAPTVSV
jgi:hypothetical protein